MTSVAERTNATMQDTFDFLQGHTAHNGHVVNADGNTLTIGDVKRFIALRLAERGLESSDVIFAQGRDGGIPHSRGEDDDMVRTGVPIVYDLFPQEAGGGYFHDMTRTICLGSAPDEVQKAYDEVMACFNMIVDALEVGESAGKYQIMTCDFFAERGHPTIKDDPGTQKGYVHRLGHGVGLEIHGLPRLSDRAEDVLEVGNVITVEPGLYYPDKGFGVRIEDLFYFDHDGQLVNLSDVAKDLVLPIG